MKKQNTELEKRKRLCVDCNKLVRMQLLFKAKKMKIMMNHCLHLYHKLKIKVMKPIMSNPKKNKQAFKEMKNQNPQIKIFQMPIKRHKAAREHSVSSNLVVVQFLTLAFQKLVIINFLI
jgi:hypothetical protein